MTSTATSGRMLNPHLCGNLTEEPVMDTGTSTLFPGEEKYLSKSAMRKKRRLLQLIEPVLGRVLEEEEQLLYVLSANQVPRLVEWIGMGLFFLHLHKVALVLTDRRVIEILMDFQGTTPSTRTRSYPWAAGPLLRTGIGKLTISPSSGPKVTWRIAARGDRRLLKALMPRVEEQITRSARQSSGNEPVSWHCPECGGTVSSDPQSCSRCDTRFRTPRMAAWLSMAFPGAGLFYAKRPVLGSLDLLGELLLFSLAVISFMLSSGFEEALGAAVFGLVVFALTKLESIHVSGILVRRAVPITTTGQANWRKFAQGGTILSIVALGLMVSATGLLHTSLSRDLEAASGNEGWQGTRMVAGFNYEDDETQRSEWVNETELHLSVFAYLGLEGETLADYRAGYEESLRQQGNAADVQWFEIPSSFDGFGAIIPFSAPEETIWFEIDYFVWDTEGPAVHQIVTIAYEWEVEAAMVSVRDFLDHATWIAAVEPTR